MLVGTYTDSGSKGIYSYSFDEATGELYPLTVTEIANPSFMAVTPDNKTVFAVTEQQSGASVSSFDYDASKGSLELKDCRPTFGKDPCHVFFLGNEVTLKDVWAKERLRNSMRKVLILSVRKDHIFIHHKSRRMVNTCLSLI